MTQKKLKDIIKKGTDKDVISNLTKCAVRLRSLSSEIPIESTDDFVGVSAKRIANYVASQIEAMPASVRSDILQFAWRTRNVFEGFLLLTFTVSSISNSKIFIAQRIADERSILEGIAELKNKSVNDIEPLSDRIINLGKVLNEHGISNAKPWRIADLSKQVGLEKEYKAFYKLYSKYVHPSGWSIINETENVNDSIYWEAFILNAQLYSNYCLGTVEQLVLNRKSAL